MQALRVNALSPDLSGVGLADTPVPVPAAGEVLVRVEAASLNFPDLLMTRGEYQFKPTVPFIPGMEMAGIVVEAEAGSPFTKGDRVMGGAKTGCFADYTVLPSDRLRHIPPALSDIAAASLSTAYVTAYTTLVELGDIQPGQWVLVHGASGGVGLALVDLAKAMGARVIASTGSPEKMVRIRDRAAPDAIIEAKGRFQGTGRGDYRRQAGGYRMRHCRRGGVRRIHPLRGLRWEADGGRFRRWHDPYGSPPTSP